MTAGGRLAGRPLGSPDRAADPSSRVDDADDAIPITAGRVASHTTKPSRPSAGLRHRLLAAPPHPRVDCQPSALNRSIPPMSTSTANSISKSSSQPAAPGRRACASAEFARGPQVCVVPSRWAGGQCGQVVGSDLRQRLREDPTIASTCSVVMQPRTQLISGAMNSLCHRPGEVVVLDSRDRRAGGRIRADCCNLGHTARARDIGSEMFESEEQGGPSWSGN